MRPVLNSLDHPMNMGVLVFSRVEKNGRALTISPPLELEPEYSPKRYYVLRHDEIGLYVFGLNRTELRQEVTDRLFRMWDAYCQEVEPTGLSEMWIRGILLDRMKEEVCTQPL